MSSTLRQIIKLTNIPAFEYKLYGWSRCNTSYNMLLILFIVSSEKTLQTAQIQIIYFTQKNKNILKKQTKKVKENSLYFLSQYENHRFNIAYIYCIHHLNIQSSTGGVTVKSNVIYLLFTLCVLVQRSKLCTVKHCVA